MNWQGEKVIRRIQEMPFEEWMKQYDLQSIIVFGSVVTEDFHEYSDVDLALLGEHPLKLVDLLNIELYFEKLLGREIDVIDLRSESVDLFVKISALNNGKSVCTVDADKSLQDFMEDIEHQYRNNETFFAIRRRDLLS